MPTIMEKCSNAMRGSVIAPPGKKLVVADLSNIEGRVLAWLAGESWKLQAFRDFDAGRGADLYKLAYAKAFGVRPEDVDSEMRQVGKVMELALGYAGGVGAFLTFALAYRIDLEHMAANAWDAIPGATITEAREFLEWQLGQGKGQYGLSDEAFIVCDSFKRLWRDAHPAVSTWWKELELACVQAVNQPGQTFYSRMLKIRRDGQWLRIGLPSGRCLCYPAPQVDDKGGLSYMGINQYSRKWERLRTYGGKLVENCIAEGTEVLTEKFGWLAIERVTPDTRVWDGDEWVSFSHCHYSGKQTTLTTYGVQMTPDHLVLTEEGWRNASSCEGHNRAACRLPNGYSLPGVGRQEIDMGNRLRLREGHSYGPLPVQEASEERECFVMRVHAQGDDREAKHPPRNGRTSGFRSLAFNVGPVPTADASGLQKLRGAGYYGLRKVARAFRKLLGRHGPELSSGIDPRTPGQFARVFESQLRMANHETSSEQHATQPLDRYATRTNDMHGSFGVLRGGVFDVALPPRPQVAGSASADTARVYDLVDCGTRSRFVVRGSDGLPLIVHNCTQGVARDVLAYRMPAIEQVGYEIVLTVHDEIISEAPDTDAFTHEHLAELMATNPEWAEGLPLAAAGFEAYRYRKG